MQTKRSHGRDVTRRLLYYHKASTRRGSIGEIVLTEQEWNHLFHKNIRDGAQTLVFVNVCWLGVQIIQTLFATRSDECLKEQDKEVGPLVTSLVTAGEYLFLLSMLPLLTYLTQKPNPVLYRTILCIYYVYLTFYGLPPFSRSCKELEVLSTCRIANQDKKSRGMYHNKDCGLQGHTIVQLMMAWLLLSPRIVPTKRMMLFLNWGWIFGLYLVATVVLHTTYDKDHDWWDIIVVLVILSVVNLIALSKKYYIEKGQMSKIKADAQQKEESKKMFDILVYMVPMHLIPKMLMSPGAVISEEIECVSIMFIMFIDFDHTARNLGTPAAVLQFLNHYFTQFDKICADNDVTKIETVGEEYVCAVGVTPEEEEEETTGTKRKLNCAETLCQLLKKRQGRREASVEAPQRRRPKAPHAELLGNLIKVAQELIRLQDRDKEVKLKMGIHTGPIVAGVIGQKLPRFRLFGDTINTAARMMQKGRPGELQFGEETYSSLPTWVPRKERGFIEMKGKGQVMTYLLDSERCETPKESASAPSRPPVIRKSLTNLCEETLATLPQVAAEAEGEAVAEAGGSSSSTAPLLDTQPAEVELIPLSLLPESPSENRREVSRLQGDVEDQRRASVAAAHHEAGGGGGRARSASVHDDGESTRQFEKVLKQVSAAEEKAQEEPTLRNWLRSVSLRIEVFPSEVEAEFIKWFHSDSICKKLDLRLDKQALALSVLTAIEIAYAVQITDVLNQEHTWYAAAGRLPVYLLTRMTAHAIIMSWRMVAGAKGWVTSAPRASQRRLLISYVLIAALMFLSYDAITVSAEIRMKTGPRSRTMHLWEGSMFSLIFVPVFMLVSTQHPFLFRPSCAFIALAVVLMVISKQDWEWFKLSNNMFFSATGMAIFVGNSLLNSFLSHTAEQSVRSRFKARHAITETKKHCEIILNTLMPVKVVEELQSLPPGSAPPSHNYKNATIAQSDLCGFTKLASTRSPQEVVEFIGELFGLFDELTDEFGVYKVETVGDAYIAGQADGQLSETWQPLNVVLFGLEMVKATHKWSSKRGFGVSCRVGVHSGECIGGIVGYGMQRYHLFGELMTQVEVLESTAPEGKVQVSEACKLAVESQKVQPEKDQPGHGQFVVFEQRPEKFLVTSKGERHDYDEVGGPTYVVRSYAQQRKQGY